MPFLKLFLSICITNFLFLLPASALEFEERDSFSRKLVGSTLKITEQAELGATDQGIAGQKCQLNYVVDIMENLNMKTVTMTWEFPEDRNLHIPTSMPTDLFQDIFVTGKAFENDYELPEFHAKSLTLSTNEAGQYVIDYYNYDDFRGIPMEKTAKIILSKDLIPIRLDYKHTETKKSRIPWKSDSKITVLRSCDFK